MFDWLLAFGFWLLAFGFWFLAFGFWLILDSINSSASSVPLCFKGFGFAFGFAVIRVHPW